MARVAGFREAIPLLRPYRRQLLLAFIVGLISTAAAAGQPILVSRIVDAFTGTFPVAMATMLVALLLVSAGATALRQLLMQRAGERFAYDTRQRLVKHIYTMPMASLDRRIRADLVSRVTTDVSKVREILTSGLMELVSTGITVLVSIILMATIDPILLALAAGVTGVIVVAIYLIGRRTRPAGLRLQEATGELASSVSRVLTSMKTIRANRAVTRETEASLKSADKALTAGLSVAWLRAVVQTFSGISVQLLLIGVVGIGAVRVAMGALSTGQLTAFIMYLMLMATPLAMFGGIVSMLGEAFGALSRVLEVESEKTESDVVDPSRSQADDPRDREVFRLDRVSFQYPSQDPNVPDLKALDDFSAVIPRGKTTAIVGPSGAGKSTVFALLERFYEPTSGTIFFQGRDVMGMSRDELRSRVSYVDQEADLLSGSVRENLQLGVPYASERKCLSAVQQVGLASNSDSAKRLLDQQVGETGEQLSGGEKQRLAIARVLVADASVFLLDEITSNLDSRNEALVKDLLLSKDLERTVLVIAHRFSTVVSADLIFVMDGGRIVAQGTHTDLMRESALYQELAERQFITDDSASTI